MQVHHKVEKIKRGVDRRGRPARQGGTEEGGEVCGRGSDHQDAAGVVVVTTPDRTGPGQLHAGQTRVDWVACKHRQEAARAGDNAAAGPEGYLSRAEAGKIGGGALSWAITIIIPSSAGGWNARGYPACWIGYWRRQQCWRMGRRGDCCPRHLWRWQIVTDGRQQATRTINKDSWPSWFWP
jgi:hypothetical protein